MVMYKGLSVINMKGGVGKTTVAVNLGWEASRRGLKTLVVDLDPQFNASVYVMGEEPYKRDVADGHGMTVYHIFQQDSFSLRDQPQPTANNVIRTARNNSGDRLDVIPSGLELAEVLKEPGSKADLLSTFLRQHASDYDLVVLDPPPTDSMATTAAYYASHYVLVPVRPEFLSSIGFPLLARSVTTFSRRAHELDMVGVFLTDVLNRNHPEYKKTKEATREFAKEEGWPFLTREIRHSTSYPRSAREGTPIADTRQARNTVKDEFSRFADVVFSHMGLSRRPRRWS